MSYDDYDARLEEAQSKYDDEVGNYYLREFGHELLYPEHYDQAVSEFTSERLKSYYVSHPALAEPAHRSMSYAQSLLPKHPEAALVFSTISAELAVKQVLLTPIVSGLLHTDRFAAMITDLTIKNQGMDRFKALLTEILKQYGGVDFMAFKRGKSTKTLWEEINEMQGARNRIVHRGELPSRDVAELGLSVCEALLCELFPQVLQSLHLHLHDFVVCDQQHGTNLHVSFEIPDHPRMRTISATATVDVPDFNLTNAPTTISGALVIPIASLDITAMRANPTQTVMYVTSLPLRYQIQFEPDSLKFTGTRLPWE